jgi:hypothetical protein
VEEGRSVIVLLVEVALVEVGRLELVLPELVEGVIPELEQVIELGTGP